MIPFFRRIRKRFADQNRPLKYFRYAIGEIVLVVIGILIALQINNANENRKNADKTEVYLLQIQDDLSKDILNINAAMEDYRVWDSLAYMLLYNKLEYKDVDDFFSIEELTYQIGTIDFHTNGYDNFIKNIDNNSNFTNEIIDDLDNLYVERKSYIIRMIEEMKEVTHNNYIKMAETKSWFNKTKIDVVANDTIINYFMNDPFYKNELVVFRRHISPIKLGVFKRDAIKTYMKIAEITKGHREIPTHINEDLFDPSGLKDYVGKYKLTSSTVPDRIKFRSFFVENEKIFTGSITRPYEMIQKAKDTFYFDGFPALYIFSRDENNKVTNLKRLNYGDVTERVKVE